MHLLKELSFIMLIGCCLLFSACKNDKTQSNDINSEKDENILKSYFFDFQEEKNPQTVKLSMLVKDIEYIPLETKPNCLIRNAYPHFAPNNIFVLSLHIIYRFDNSGKFLNTIGKVGKGPEEFTWNYGCAIDENNKRIYIRGRANKIVSYNYQGDFCGVFPIASHGIPGLEFFPPDNLLIPFAESQSNNGHPILLVLNTKGEIKNKFYNQLKRKDFRMGVFPSLYSVGNNIMFNPGLSDTLFKLTDSLLIPEAVFNFGTKKFDPDKDMNKLINNSVSGKYYISEIQEFPEYYFLDISKHHGKEFSGLNYLINKKSQEKICIKPTTDNFIFENDLNGGPEPGNLQLENDSLLVSFIQAVDLINWVKENKHKRAPSVKMEYRRKELEELANSLTENDNPVLVKYILK